MLSVTDIKHRIKSVEDTRQITKAMMVISISKMKKAIQKYENNLTYFQKVRQTIKDILLHSKDVTHPFLLHRPSNRTAYVVIAGDKGLAGGYNNNVLNLAWQHIESRKEKYVFTVGQMSRDFFQARKMPVDVEFLHTTQEPTLYDARSMAMDIIDLYKKNLMDEVLVVFTKMHSSVNQKPMIIKLLPVEMDDLMDIDEPTAYDSQIEYMPSPKAVLDMLVPQYIIGLLYATLVQSVASEHCSRMLSMSSATKNADEMIADLTLDYNRARQESVTEEISEIVSAASLLL